MSLLEIFVLAVGAMFWPFLLVVVVIAIGASRPVNILGWFYVGGMIAAVSVGAAIVFALQDSPFMSGSHLEAAPWVDIVVGALALAGAFLLQRRSVRQRTRPRPPGEKSRSSEWIERLAERGGPLAFAAGIVATILPGPLVIIGMANIAQLGYSATATLVVIVVFFLIMFTFVEVPLVGFVVAPEWTTGTVAPFNAWLGRNLLRLAVWALATIGVAEIVRGIVTALRQ